MRISKTDPLMFILMSLAGIRCCASDKSSQLHLSSIARTLLTDTVNNLTKNTDFLTIFSFLNDMNFNSIIDTYKGTLNEDIFLNGTQLLSKYGYPSEEHEVITSDQYILKMIRIPGRGPAVFVMPGGPCSPDELITIGPQAGLAYVLADAGYDVWLGSARGTKYCKRHVSLSPDTAAFWDFSIDEIGRYDMAAMIDYVFHKNNNKKVNVIGHSQGTTSSFILCSERPEYNEKISVLIMMSPIVSLRHTRSAVFRLGSWVAIPPVVEFLESIGLYSVFASPETVMALGAMFCGTPELATAICFNFYGAIFGADYTQINSTCLPVAYSHFPTGTSMKVGAHNIQMIKSDRFRRYDYGRLPNLKKYGSIIPPEYSLKKVTAKVVLINGDNDWISVEEDYGQFKELPNMIEYYKVPYVGFSHADFVFAKDVKSLLYEKLLEILEANN